MPPNAAQAYPSNSQLGQIIGEDNRTVTTDTTRRVNPSANCYGQNRPAGHNAPIQPACRAAAALPDERGARPNFRDQRRPQQTGPADTNANDRERRVMQAVATVAAPNHAHNNQRQMVVFGQPAPNYAGLNTAFFALAAPAAMTNNAFPTAGPTNVTTAGAVAPATSLGPMRNPMPSAAQHPSGSHRAPYHAAPPAKRNKCKRRKTSAALAAHSNPPADTRANAPPNQLGTATVVYQPRPAVADGVNHPAKKRRQQPPGPPAGPTLDNPLTQPPNPPPRFPHNGIGAGNKGGAPQPNRHAPREELQPAGRVHGAEQPHVGIPADRAQHLDDGIVPVLPPARNPAEVMPRLVRQEHFDRHRQGTGTVQPPAALPLPPPARHPDENLQLIVREDVRNRQPNVPQRQGVARPPAGLPPAPARRPDEDLQLIVREDVRNRQPHVLQRERGVQPPPALPPIPARIPDEDLQLIVREDDRQLNVSQRQRVDQPQAGVRPPPARNGMEEIVILEDGLRPDRQANRPNQLPDRPRGLIGEAARRADAAASLSPVCKILAKFGIDHTAFKRASSKAEISDQDLLTLPDMPWDWALISKFKPSLKPETLLALQDKPWDFMELSRHPWPDEVILQLKDKTWDFRVLSKHPWADATILQLKDKKWDFNRLSIFQAPGTELLLQTTDKAWDWGYLLREMLFKPASRNALHKLLRKSLLLSDEVRWDWTKDFINNRNLRDALLSVALREITSESSEPWDYARLSSAPWFPIDAIISVGMDKPWDMDALSARHDLTTDHLFDILPDAGWNMVIVNRNSHIVMATRKRRELLRAKAIIMKFACAPPRGRLYRHAINDFKKHQMDVTDEPT